MPPTITFTIAARTDGDISAIPIGFDQRAIFGKARPPVVVTITGHSCHSTIAIMNGETFVPLRRSHQQAAGVIPGRRYEVTLTLDSSPRTVELPEDLAVRLDMVSARAGWDRLGFTAQCEHIEAIERAKRPETREKCVVLALAAATSRRP